MSESIKRMKVNKVLEGTDCGSCGAMLDFGDDAVVCEACKSAHHATCWDRDGGCATEGCENAPLKQLEGAAAVRARLPTGRMECPYCGKIIKEGAPRCVYCRKVIRQAGGPRDRGRGRGARGYGSGGPAPGATAALVLGIVSIVFCGIILGPLAIAKSNEAKRAIARNPNLTGEGQATAGMICGIIGLVLNILMILFRVVLFSAAG